MGGDTCCCRAGPLDAAAPAAGAAGLCARARATGRRFGRAVAETPPGDQDGVSPGLSRTCNRLMCVFVCVCVCVCVCVYVYVHHSDLVVNVLGRSPRQEHACGDGHKSIYLSILLYN